MHPNMTAEQYDNLPQNVKDILNSFDEEKDGYKECHRIFKALNKIGWTCDYDLSAEIFDIEPLKPQKEINVHVA